MKCPYCGELASEVIDSRVVEEGSVIRRRRRCVDCERRFTTYEKVDDIPIIVVKRDGRREPFKRDKIISGLLRAGEKRRIPLEVFEGLVDELERELRNRFAHEATTDEIGDILLNKLRRIDEVTYVRYASVFRQYEDIESFKKELERMIELQEREREHSDQTIDY